MHTAEINRGITNLLASMDRLVTSPDITNDLAGLRITLDEYRSFGEKLNRRLPKKWDSKLNRFVADDDWLLWDFTSAKRGRPAAGR